MGSMPKFEPEPLIDSIMPVQEQSTMADKVQQATIEKLHRDMQA